MKQICIYGFEECHYCGDCDREQEKEDNIKNNERRLENDKR